MSPESCMSYGIARNRSKRKNKKKPDNLFTR